MSTHLVDFLNLRARAAAAGGGRNFVVVVHRGRAASALVHLRDDGVADALQFLHLVVELVRFRKLVAVQPANGRRNSVLDLLLVGGRELRGDLLVLDSVPHVVGVVLQRVLGFHLLLVLLVLRLVLLRLLHHLLDLVLRQPALVVGDRDLVLLSRRLVLRRHVENAVGVDVEADGDLGNSTRGRGNAGQLELAQQVVVAGAGALALVNLDEDSGLVVGVGREHLLLLRGNRRVPRDQHRHHTPGGFQTLGERGHVEEKQVLNLLVALAAQDGGLNGGAVRHGLVRVDALAQFLAVEEVLQELLHLGNTSGTAHQHHVVDSALVHLGVPQALLHRFHALPEEVHVQLLESGASDGRVEVHALVQRVDLDSRLSGGGQRPLRPLARGPQPSQCPGVAGDVLLVLPFELLHEVIHHPVVEVFPAQVSVSGGSLHLEDTLLDGEQRDIEGAAPEVEDQDVLLSNARGFLVESVGDSSGGGLVNDAHHVQARNDASILRGLALRVVEVGGNSHDGVLDGGAQICFGNFFHLRQDHGRDFLGGELLILTLVLDGDHGLIGGP